MKKKLEIKGDALNDLVKEEKKKKRGWLFLLLLLVFAGIIFYAYRVFAPTKKVLAFVNIPNIVYQSEIFVSGVNAEPGSRLRLLVNGEELMFLIADENGNFSSKIQLEKGDNKIEVSTIESDPNKEQKVTTFITYKNQPPKLKIIEPINNSEIRISKGTKEKEIEIKGITDQGAKIVINDKSIEINENGSFETKVVLKLGSNTINIVASKDEEETKENLTINLIEETNKIGSNTNNNNKSSSFSSGNSSGSSTSFGNNSSGSGSNNDQTDNQNGNFEPQPIVIYPSKVIISYIAYTSDYSADGFGEYIEIKNTGGEDKDITGWIVSDGDGNTFVFPNYILASGATVRITTNTGRFVFNSSSPVWLRVGEPGYLKDSAGRLVDVYSY